MGRSNRMGGAAGADLARTVAFKASFHIFLPTTCTPGTHAPRTSYLIPFIYSSIYGWKEFMVLHALKIPRRAAII